MRPPGLRQRLGFLAVTALVVSTLAPTRVSAQTDHGQSDAIAQKRAEAAELAAELERLAATVSRLAEEHNQARLGAEAVEAEAAAAQQALADTERRHRTARDRLRTQAVDAYVRGGTVALQSVLSVEPKSADELSLRRHYVRQIVERQRNAIEALRAAQLQLAERKSELDEARDRARAALDKVAGSRDAATRAAAAQRAALARAEGELSGLVRAEAARRAAEQARQAAAELEARRAREEAERRRTTATTAPSRSGGTTATTSPSQPAPPPASGAAAAVAEAKRQLGKPYEWGGSGPDSFDCSGLTAWAWRAGGKSLPHSSKAQYSGTVRVNISDIRPGDLLFYGNPIHHVGIYVGDGQMIEAPETGKNVRYASIARRDYVGAGRVQ